MASDFGRPYPVQFSGSRLARWLLRRLGWQVRFEGFPDRQGVVVVYPHTSNWDFVVLVLAKWALGVQIRFWAKDSLFRVPLFGGWLRWLGGVPVDRRSAQGRVGETVARMRAARERGDYFWLALAPEGTRKRMPGWRSGFYRTAVQAGVPLGLARLDYRCKEVRVCDFIRLSGDETADLTRIAAVYSGVTGCIPANAAPVRLLDASAPRAETIVRRT